MSEFATSPLCLDLMHTEQIGEAHWQRDNDRQVSVWCHDWHTVNRLTERYKTRTAYVLSVQPDMMSQHIVVTIRHR